MASFPINRLRIFAGQLLNRIAPSLKSLSENSYSAAELDKYTPNRDSRILFYRAGGISGRNQRPINITLDILSDGDFARVVEIVDILQTPKATVEMGYGLGDSCYFVHIGDKGTPQSHWISEDGITPFWTNNGTGGRVDTDLKCIFEGLYFKDMPVIVNELGKILRSYSNTRPTPKPRAPSSGSDDIK